MQKSKNKETKTPAFSYFMLGVFTVFLASILLFGLVRFVPKMFNKNSLAQKDSGNIFVKTALAAEIYPEFFCPCCGQPLDPDNICCGAMKEMIDYIDKLEREKLSRDEIIMRTVKKFGINSLVREEVKAEIKEKLASLAPADSPKIVFDKTTEDLGVVSQSKGVVSTTFDFTNKGQGELVIDRLETSCGCTSALVVYKDKEGPQFTMPGHGKENPTDWSVSIGPGDSAKLKVYYDPNAHGKQEEKSLDITRSINIFSNDPVDFEKVVRIDLNQIP